jgi:hypothetical protein
MKAKVIHHCLGALATGTVFVLFVTGLVVATSKQENIHVHPEAYQED